MAQAYTSGLAGLWQNDAMARHDASTAEVLVFTFKEGLLSPLAHDLKLRVTRFSLEVAETSDSVAAEFDPRSLVVLTAMKQDWSWERSAAEYEALYHKLMGD